MAWQLTLTAAVAAAYDDDWNDDEDTKCTTYSTNDTCYAAYRQGCSDGKEEQREIILHCSILLISVLNFVLYIDPL